MYEELKKNTYKERRGDSLPDGDVERVTASIDCNLLSSIDNLIANTRMFSNRSDFIFSALREFYIEYLNVGEKHLRSFRETSPKHPAKTLDQYDTFMIELCKEYIREFNERTGFGMGKKKQISVYITKNMRPMLSMMADMSRDKEKYGMIISAAICFYSFRCLPTISKIDSFIKLYNEIYTEAYGPE